MRPTPSLITLGLAILSLGLAPTARAAVYSLGGNIDSTQEVPANASTGSGAILGFYDDVSNELSWDISFSGLSGPATGMHFHGAADPGVNAGVRVNIGSISGLGSPSVGSTTITGDQGAELLGGLWYVNIHTATFPGGEIRGQVAATLIPEPSAALLSALALGAAGLRRRRPTS